jgi:hypothetical protein
VDIEESSAKSTHQAVIQIAGGRGPILTSDF